MKIRLYIRVYGKLPQILYMSYGVKWVTKSVEIFRAAFPRNILDPQIIQNQIKCLAKIDYKVYIL